MPHRRRHKHPCDQWVDPCWRAIRKRKWVECGRCGCFLPSEFCWPGTRDPVFFNGAAGILVKYCGAQCFNNEIIHVMMRKCADNDDVLLRMLEAHIIDNDDDNVIGNV